MSLDTLIAIIAILFAVYQIMPERRKLDLQLKLHRIHIIFTLIIFILSNILIFFDLGEFAYISVLIYFGLIIFSLRKDDLDITQMSKFGNLIQELFIEKRYYEIISIINSYLDEIISIRNQLTENDDREKSAIDRIFRLISSEIFIIKVFEINPIFGLRLTKKDIREAPQINDILLTKLLITKGSPLHREIRMYLNHSTLNDETPILNYYFSDVDTSIRLAVWRPLGNIMFRIFREHYKLIEGDEYNHSVGDFDEHGKWIDPIFLGIIFFELMVKSGLHQGKNWHMELYYFPKFVDAIVKNYNPHPLFSDLNAEWPTKYSYFLC
ncbi:MAG: hypothetical protein FVQ83_08960 [Chloroflexi bacterium]|nr:hypothetical protein [Chloroflexota bacterium]